MKLFKLLYKCLFSRLCKGGELLDRILSRYHIFSGNSSSSKRKHTAFFTANYWPFLSISLAKFLLLLLGGENILKKMQRLLWFRFWVWFLSVISKASYTVTSSQRYCCLQKIFVCSFRLCLFSSVFLMIQNSGIWIMLLSLKVNTNYSLVEHMEHFSSSRYSIWYCIVYSFD